MDLALRCTMRGEDKKQSSMLVLMSPETRVPQSHPLRAIKKLADAALAKLSPVFDAMYAEGGRPSIPPSACSSRCCSWRCTRCEASANSASSSTTTALRLVSRHGHG
jgi:hypothetical protein